MVHPREKALSRKVEIYDVLTSPAPCLPTFQNLLSLSVGMVVRRMASHFPGRVRYYSKGEDSFFFFFKDYQY